MTDQKPIRAASAAKLRRYRFTQRVLTMVLVAGAAASLVAWARAQKPVAKPQLKTAAVQMQDRADDATRQLEALNNSSRHVQELKSQCEEAQERHTRQLGQFLDAVDRNPSQWSLRVVQDGKTASESPWTPPIHDVLLAASLSRGGSPGGGAGCPDRVGCANVGQFGNKCFYVCKTVAR